MMRRIALLVVVLAAAALVFAPSAVAAPGLDEVPEIVQVEEASIPALNASVHGDVQVDVDPSLRVAGSASATVGQDESTTDPDESATSPGEPTVGPDASPVSVQGDDPGGEARLSTGVGAGPVAPIAAATAAVGLLATLALAMETVRSAASSVGTQVGRIVRGAARHAIWLPLFSRIPRAQLLENPVRAGIHAAVTENPGLSLSDVKSHTGIAWGTAVHHLEKLERDGIVVSATKRAHRRYYVAGSPAARRRDDIAVMAHPTARRIATLVSAQPGIDQTGICRTLGLNNPAASKHLRGFEAQGLVLAKRDGRKRLYHPTPALDTALPYVQAMQVEAPVWTQQRVAPMAPVAA